MITSEEASARLKEFDVALNETGVWRALEVGEKGLIALVEVAKEVERLNAILLEVSREVEICREQTINLKEGVLAIMVRDTMISVGNSLDTPLFFEYLDAKEKNAPTF